MPERIELKSLRELLLEKKYDRIIESVGEGIEPVDKDNFAQNALLIIAKIQLGHKLDIDGLLRDVLHFGQLNLGELTDCEVSDFGLIYLLNSDAATALHILKTRSQSLNDDAVYLNRKGVACLMLQDVQGAISYFTAAQGLQPARKEWLENLAFAYIAQSQYEQAESILDQLKLLWPDSAVIEPYAAAIERSVADLNASLSEIDARYHHAPTMEDLRLLIRAYIGQGDLVKAEEILAELFDPTGESAATGPGFADSPPSADPSDTNVTPQIFFKSLAIGERVEIVKNYVAILDQTSKQAKIPFVMRSLVKDPSYEPDAWLEHKYIAALAERNAFKAADERLAVLKGAPNSEALVELAQADIAIAVGDLEGAERIYRALLNDSPYMTPYLSGLGAVLSWKGDLEEASKIYLKLADINPGALASAVNSGYTPDLDDPLFKKLVDLATPTKKSTGTAGTCFAVAKVYEKHKKYPEAMEFLDKANSIVANEVKYDPDKYEAQISNIISATQDAFINLIPEASRFEGFTPIFVVGMPRSGTTLTEQVLSAHELIGGAGELPAMRTIEQRFAHLTSQAYPQCLLAIDGDMLQKARNFYVHQARTVSSSRAPYIVDKMPHNFQSFAVIYALFPHAKIVHIKRDPRDTALSNYQQNFRAKWGGLGYSFEIDHIARQLNDYTRIVHHWKKLYNRRFFEFRYEDMVTDVTTVTKSLASFIGVEWSEQMLRFNENKSLVRTASLAQVRKPIYKSSAKKWERFPGFEERLMRLLKQEVIDLWKEN